MFTLDTNLGLRLLYLDDTDRHRFASIIKDIFITIFKIDLVTVEINKPFSLKALFREAMDRKSILNVRAIANNDLKIDVEFQFMKKKNPDNTKTHIFKDCKIVDIEYIGHANKSPYDDLLYSKTIKNLITPKGFFYTNKFKCSFDELFNCKSISTEYLISIHHHKYKHLDDIISEITIEQVFYKDYQDIKLKFEEGNLKASMSHYIKNHKKVYKNINSDLMTKFIYLTNILSAMSKNQNVADIYPEFSKELFFDFKCATITLSTFLKKDEKELCERNTLLEMLLV